LHGWYLVLHHGWRAWRGARPAAWWGGALTFLAVMLAWVVFRAPDVATAADILRALAGGNGIALPRGLAAYGHWLGPHASFDGIRWIEFGGLGLPALGLAALLAFAMPNTQEIFCHYEPAIEQIFQRSPLAWRPSKRWSLAFAALFLGCLFSMNKASEFLYFQF
jgi:alginate O-acetyltransferase complex protein AlgI